MTPPEQPTGKQQRVPAGSLEPMGGPNYALPGASQITPPPAPRIPPALLFGTLLFLLLGAAAILFFSPRPASEELTAEKIGALIHEQETIAQSEVSPIVEQPTGSAVLEIETYPPGASVTIDGRPAGTTPIRQDQLPSQWYVLSVRKDGHQPVDSLVYLETSQRTLLSMPLTPLAFAEGESGADERGTDEPSVREPLTRLEQRTPVQSTPQTPREAIPPQPAPPPARTGTLRVTSSPSGVDVTLDGRNVGTTPLSLPTIEVGEHTIGLVLADHESQSLPVEVAAGQQNTVHVALTPIQTVAQTGSLSIAVQPWGSIYINGSLRARDTDVRYTATLPVGEHRVRVEHPSLGTWERTVEVSPDQPVSLTADLTPRSP